VTVVRRWKSGEMHFTFELWVTGLSEHSLRYQDKAFIQRYCLSRAFFQRHMKLRAADQVPGSESSLINLNTKEHECLYAVRIYAITRQSGTDLAMMVNSLRSAYLLNAG
jgi:hypothetical protein